MEFIQEEEIFVPSWADEMDAADEQPVPDMAEFATDDLDMDTRAKQRGSKRKDDEDHQVQLKSLKKDPHSLNKTGRICKRGFWQLWSKRHGGVRPKKHVSLKQHEVQAIDRHAAIVAWAQWIQKAPLQKETKISLRAHTEYNRKTRQAIKKMTEPEILLYIKAHPYSVRLPGKIYKPDGRKWHVSDVNHHNKVKHKAKRAKHVQYWYLMRDLDRYVHDGRIVQTIYKALHGYQYIMDITEDDVVFLSQNPPKDGVYSLDYIHNLWRHHAEETNSGLYGGAHPEWIRELNMDCVGLFGGCHTEMVTPKPVIDTSACTAATVDSVATESKPSTPAKVALKAKTKVGSEFFVDECPLQGTIVTLADVFSSRRRNGNRYWYCRKCHVTIPDDWLHRDFRVVPVIASSNVVAKKEPNKSTGDVELTSIVVEPSAPPSNNPPATAPSTAVAAGVAAASAVVIGGSAAPVPLEKKEEPKYGEPLRGLVLDADATAKMYSAVYHCYFVPELVDIIPDMTKPCENRLITFRNTTMVNSQTEVIRTVAPSINSFFDMFIRIVVFFIFTSVCLDIFAQSVTIYNSVLNPLGYVYNPWLLVMNGLLWVVLILYLLYKYGMVRMRYVITGIGFRYRRFALLFAMSFILLTTNYDVYLRYMYYVILAAVFWTMNYTVYCYYHAITAKNVASFRIDYVPHWVSVGRVGMPNMVNEPTFWSLIKNKICLGASVHVKDTEVVPLLEDSMLVAYYDLFKERCQHRFFLIERGLIRG
jgi:hypothetical protein